MGKRQQIKTDAHKRLRPKKRLVGNKAIVIIKISTACLLFFACCLFFFENTGMFLRDLKNFSPFPIVFFAGLAWVCGYIANLVGKIEDRNLYLADRFDWLYKIIFTITILATVVRSFLFAKPYLNVPTVIVTLFVVSGIITLLTPKIIDNNNEEF